MNPAYLVDNKHRRSKYLPDTLAERYETLLGDRTLEVIRDDIALLELRLSQLLERAKYGEQPDKWEYVSTRFVYLTQMIHQENVKEVEKTLKEISVALQGVDQDYKAWAQIMDLLEMRRRMAESETKRLVDTGQMISAEDAMKLVQNLLGAVRRHVADKESYRAIAYEFVIATGGARRRNPDERGGEVQSIGPGELDPEKLLDTGNQRPDPPV